jgi:4,5-dihydroxyphthalate decarboxylase
MSLLARGDRRYVAIPVFLSRHFRHGYFFVHGESDIREPKDLVGRKVGVPEYEMTAAMWQRALLQHEYGVMPQQIHWFQGGEFKPGYMQRQHLTPPPGVRIDTIPEDRTLHDMVASGEVDALLSPHRPAALADGSGRVRRLFPDFPEAERDFYRRTGFFPIMHLTVIRRDLYERERWLPPALMPAFVEAQRRGWQRMLDLGAMAVMLPWLTSDLELLQSTMGPRHWPYGFRENYAILSAMCQYSHEQHLSARLLTPEELFAPETYDLPGTAGS